MKELEILLDRLWISREENKDLYYQIKDKTFEMKDFLENKLGYKLIVNPSLIKLEKIPGKAEVWMGIGAFEDVREYVFLCLLLVFLEDREKNEQFVLSQLTEFIQSEYPGDEKVEWTLFSHRKSMVKVLRFAENTGMLWVTDGDENGFMDKASAEVLYESTGLSKYFVRSFTGNLMNYNSLEDIENGEGFHLAKERGDVRKNRVYRRLTMSPAVYCMGEEDQDYYYIKNFRNFISRDLEKAFGGKLHLHKNGAFVLVGAEKNFKNVFPDSKAISDIALQMNGLIVKQISDNRLQRRQDDTVLLSITGFGHLVSECRNRFSCGWSKEYREMTSERLCEEVIRYMENCALIEINRGHSEICIMPGVGKIIGRYPEDFISDGQERGERE